MTNTGQVEIPSVKITDSMLGLAAQECLATPLAVGASTSCLATTYSVKSGDLGYGSIQNVASAQAYYSDGSTLGAKASDSTDTPVADQVLGGRTTLPGTGGGSGGGGTGGGGYGPGIIPGGVYGGMPGMVISTNDGTTWQPGQPVPAGYYVDPRTGKLAKTGADVLVLLAAGLGMLLVGAWLLVLAKRRRDEEDEEGTDTA